MTAAPFAFLVRPSAILDVGGVDRASFLQGQLASDVRLAEPGRTIPAIGLTPRGKLLYAGRLVGMEESLRLLVPLIAREQVLAHLSKYAAFQKVSISDRSDELVRISIWGVFPPDISVAGALRLPAEADIDAELLTPAGQVAAVLAALAAGGGRLLSEQEAQTRRIEAGRPEWGRDADESHLPDEAGFSDAVSTNKGCYVGQEIVARMRTYGRANKRLVGFRFPDGILPAGSILRRPDESEPSRTEAGRVTSAGDSDRFGPIGLGYAFRDVAIGDRLIGPADSGRITIVSALPFSG